MEKIMRDSEKIELLIREVAHGSQSEFARAIGTDGPLINRLLSGVYRITTKRAVQISSAYPSVNYDWLVGLSDYPGDISVSVVRNRYARMLAQKNEIIDKLCAEIERQGRIIDKLSK